MAKNVFVELSPTDLRHVELETGDFLVLQSLNTEDIEIFVVGYDERHGYVVTNLATGHVMTFLWGATVQKAINTLNGRYIFVKLIRKEMAVVIVTPKES